LDSKEAGIIQTSPLYLTQLMQRKETALRLEDKDNYLLSYLKTRNNRFNKNLRLHCLALGILTLEKEVDLLHHMDRQLRLNLMLALKKLTYLKAPWDRQCLGAHPEDWEWIHLINLRLPILLESDILVNSFTLVNQLTKVNMLYQLAMLIHQRASISLRIIQQLKLNRTGYKLNNSNLNEAIKRPLLSAKGYSALS
jgi:hypothetical protein